MVPGEPVNPEYDEEYAGRDAGLGLGSVMFSALMYDMNAEEIEEDIELRRKAERRRITPGFALPKKKRKKKGR
jgi:hypothetical protein